jgi:hypothetical protein
MDIGRKVKGSSCRRQQDHRKRLLCLRLGPRSSSSITVAKHEEFLFPKLTEGSSECAFLFF